MPFRARHLPSARHQSLVSDGTRHNLSAVIATLKKTLPEKIEASAGQYNEELTEHFEKFQIVGQQDFLDGFKHAQIMAGYVTTIMAKAGLKA